MIPLQAVIFDYGNVLCLPQPPAELMAMAEAVGLPLAKFEEFYWRKRLPYDRTELTPEEYWDDFCRMAGVQPPPENIARAMELDCLSWSHANPAMVAWARQIRSSGVKTAILSNMPLPLREHLDRQHAWIHQFDHRVFSCDVMMAKPDPAIYRLVLEGLGVEPSQALFLDDRPDNIHAARSLGIHSILFTDPHQAAAEWDGAYLLPAFSR